HLDAGAFQMLVEVNFLRRHRLRLHDGLHAVLPREVEDVFADFGRIVGAEDLGAARFDLRGEALGELVEMRGGVALALGDLRAHGLEVDAFVRLFAAHAIGLGETAQRAGEVRVVERGVNGVAKLLAHQFTPAMSSTKTMMSFSGPCTPMVSTRSMSAVRLGPVMNEM